MASSSSGTPCAACKFLRRKCTPECVFAAYFPPDQPQKFANVHKIFGASNVSKLLNELPAHQREDAVNSLAYEAEARVRDPVYGCVGAMSILYRQVLHLQKELVLARTELSRYVQQAGLDATGRPPLQGFNLASPRDQIMDLASFSREELLEYARIIAGRGSSHDAATLAALGLTTQDNLETAGMDYGAGPASRPDQIRPSSSTGRHQNF